MGKHPCPFRFVAQRGRNSGFSTFFDTVFSSLQFTVFVVIAEVASYDLRMVLYFDKSLVLVLQGLSVSGFGQEQAHFITLVSHGGLMGEDVKDDHVAGIGIEPLQGHDIVTGHLLGTGLLPGLRQHFPDSPCLAGQTVILLNIPDHIHALLIGERTELFQKAFRRVLHGLVRCIAPGHVNFIQSGPLAGALDLIDHPFFSFT